MKHCNIEMGTINDIDALTRLYHDVNDYLASGINYPGWIKGVYPIKETAHTAIQKGNLFIFKVNHEIAGSIILNHEQEKAFNQVNWQIEAKNNHILVIHTLVIHPKFMKQGISKKLMTFAKEYALQKAMKSIRLDVAIQNTPAISLYEKCGYKYIGTVDLGLEHAHLKWFKLYELVL